MRTLLGVLTLTIALTTGGAIARQALHLNHTGPIVGWRCPHCGIGNAGDPEATFRAVCRACSADSRWDDVVAVTGSVRPSAAVVR